MDKIILFDWNKIICKGGLDVVYETFKINLFYNFYFKSNKKN